VLKMGRGMVQVTGIMRLMSGRRPERLRMPTEVTYIAPPASADIQRFVENPSAATFNRLKASATQEGRAAELSIGEEIGKLSAITEGVDVLHLLSALHVFDAIRRSTVSGAEGWGADAMLDFFAGVVTSRPEADVVRHLTEPFNPQLILDVDNQLRVIANLQMSIDLAESYNDAPRSTLDSTIRLLKLEHHFDRMSGFDPHLRRIATEVFDIVDDRAVSELGFKFTDAIRFADAYTRQRMKQGDSVNDELELLHRPLPPDADDESKVQWRIGHALYFTLLAAAPVEREIADELAPAIGISRDGFERLVAAMATPLESQSLVDLHSDNAVRTRPILQLSSGEWMWCRPNDFMHGVFDWALAASASSVKLTSAFDKARQTVAERLPQQLLGEIFADRVHCSVTYPAEESDAETDTLVALAAANIILESKGGRFTPPARRGAPKRVETHAKNIIARAADQCLRTAEAIASGLPLKDRQGHVIEVDRSGVSLGMIVTFDRIDPFNTHLGRPTNDDLAQRSWIVCLADLLMIAEILPTPAEFFAYAQKRIEMVRDDSYFSLVEADVLGAWCDNRLTAFEPIADGGPTVINVTSDSMNAYFTPEAVEKCGTDSIDDLAFGNSPKPTPGVPAEILAALDQLLAAQSERWSLRCKQAFEVPPTEWRLLGRRLLIARNPEKFKGRNARKQLRRMRHGFVLGGVLPIQVSSADVPLDSVNFLVIEP
jgi:hypothetical protein